MLILFVVVEQSIDIGVHMMALLSGIVQSTILVFVQCCFMP